MNPAAGGEAWTSTRNHEDRETWLRLVSELVAAPFGRAGRKTRHKVAMAKSPFAMVESVLSLFML